MSTQLKAQPKNKEKSKTVKRITKMNVIVQKTWDESERQGPQKIPISKDMQAEVDLTGG